MESEAADSTEDTTPSKQTAAILKDLTDACNAQQIALEIVSNICSLGAEGLFYFIKFCNSKVCLTLQLWWSCG